MWVEVNKDTLKNGETYKTCMFMLGVPTMEQEMMFNRGLWWVGATGNQTYVYYSPTHIWKD